MARVVDLTFGSGRFKCLGKSVATIQLNKVIVEVRYVHSDGVSRLTLFLVVYA